MLSKDELNKIDELGSQEKQRLYDLILAQTLKNKGECVGFIDSTILSANLLVNNLINIRRMDTPYEFEDDFIEHCQNEGYNIENKWPAKAMFDSDLSANKAALELGFISGWYDFCNYETKLKGLDYNLIKALAEIELDGVVACTDHNHMVLNMLGLSDEMLNKFYHNEYKTLYDLPNFDNILPSDEAEWSEDDIAFYQNYEPLVNSMSEKEFNKCCDLLNDETIPCVYSDAIEEALGIKSDNAWKFDPLMNSMYGHGEEYKQDYINSMNNPETQGRDGLLESHEKENSKMLTQYKIYFNDQQLKNMKEMPVKEFDAEQKKWIQQKDANGNLLTETRCIIDLPKEAYYLKKDGHRLDLDGYNLVMRNQFFRSEHDNGYYCIVESDKKYRLDKISPLKDENGEVKKTQDGKTMWDFDSKKSLYFSGKQLKVMMEAWKTKEKKPLDLNAYKQKAKEYNDSKEKDEVHKGQKQER